MGFKYDKYNKYHRFGRQVLITIASLIVFVMLWWMIANLVSKGILFDTPTKNIISKPNEVWNALIDLIANGDPRTNTSIWTYIKTSLKSLLAGFGLALLITLPMGLILGTFKLVREFTSPWVEILRPIAPIAWATVFLQITQNQFNATVLVVFVGIFFPMLTNIIFGVQKIDGKLIDASKTLGASNLQIFYKILIPSTIPYFMNGVKIGLGIGWMCIVAAEMVSSSPGIGFFVSYVSEFSYPAMYAGILIIAILGLMTTGVAEYAHKIINKRMGVETN